MLFALPALTPLAAKGLAGLGIAGASIGIPRIPIFQNKAIKDARSQDDYNPATNKFKEGKGWNFGDDLRWLFTGASEEEVLNSEKREYEATVNEANQPKVNQIKRRFARIPGFSAPDDLTSFKAGVGQDRTSYEAMLDSLKARATAIEELQGVLPVDMTLRSAGITPNSNIGSINKAERLYNPLSEFNQTRDARRDLSAARGESVRQFNATHAQRAQIAGNENWLQQQRIDLENLNRLQSELQRKREFKQQMEVLKNNAANTEFNQKMLKQKFDRDGDWYQDDQERIERLERKTEKRRQAELFGEVFNQLGDLLVN